jgi:methylene-fatty-acyl-phospholipid synthase
MAPRLVSDVVASRNLRQRTPSFWKRITPPGSPVKVLRSAKKHVDEAFRKSFAKVETLSASKVRWSFVSAILLPQLVIVILSSLLVGASGPTNVWDPVLDSWRQWLTPLISMSQWTTWTSSHNWQIVALGLGIERICYTFVWLCPKTWMRLCRALPLKGRCDPVDVVVAVFFANKLVQILLPLWWWTEVNCASATDGYNGATTGALATKWSLVRLTDWSSAKELQPSGMWLHWAVARDRLLYSPYAVLTGIHFVLLGQILNLSIYHAIGKNGVYYGARLGKRVPWVNGFPFNFAPHPQYVGAAMTAAGVMMMLGTEAHLTSGLAGLVVVQTAWYVIMGLIENHCPAYF